MAKQKMEPKLVAKDEYGYIVSKHKVPLKDVLKAIAALKSAGKGYRSRKSIYAQLRANGFVINTKKY